MTNRKNEEADQAPRERMMAGAPISLIGHRSANIDGLEAERASAHFSKGVVMAEWIANNADLLSVIVTIIAMVGGLGTFILGRIDKRMDAQDAKIDRLSDQFALMGFELASRVGRLEGRQDLPKEKPESSPETKQVD